MNPTEKRMRLRYAGVCRVCSTVLPAQHEALYDRASRSVRCLECTSTAGPNIVVPPAAGEPIVFDAGVAGASAQREFERRKANREQRTRAQHPRLGGLILALSGTPQSIRAWESGARGEAALGARLDRLASDSVAVLHDRRVPGTRANIDHIVVTTGGVFVIDAKRYVEQRPALRVEGGILRPRLERLTVGGRDRTKLVEGVLGQVQLVETIVGDEAAEPQGVLCFIDAEWPLVGAFFSVRAVQVVSPRRLVKLLVASQGDVDVARVRDKLTAALPVA